MEEKYCYGCGHKLQTSKEEALGYISDKVDSSKEAYCVRCYNMIYRNETPKTFLEDKDYWELFNDIILDDKLYVLVIDIFNIEGSLIDEMISKLSNKNLIVVINKRDLLPKLIKDSKIYKYIKNHPKLKNINIQDILVVSAQKKYNIDKLLEIINYYRESDVYLIGLANVGKSSLINALINSVMTESKEYISTSYYGGTTLGIIKIPFDDNSDLIDTPGIVTKSQVFLNSDSQTLKTIIPKGEIRPKTYQLHEKQTLFITGFCQINFLSGTKDENTKQGFTVYKSNAINIHRTSYEKAEEFRKKHLGIDIITPPFKKQLKNITFTKHKVKIIGKNVDLVLNELCFINFKNIEEELEIELIIPDFSKYYIREGLI